MWVIAALVQARTGMDFRDTVRLRIAEPLGLPDLRLGLPRALHGRLADISNAGTLYAFTMVAVAVMVLRRTASDRARSFRVPGVMIVAPLTIIGCVFLFLNLPTAAMLFLPGWSVIGLVVYFLYSRSRSHLGRGIVEVVDAIGGEETMVPISPE